MEVRTESAGQKSKPSARKSKKPDAKNAVAANADTEKKAAAPRASRASTDNNEKTFRKSLDATQLYLNEIGYSPLLTAEEEVYFSRMALRERIPQGFPKG